MSQTPAGWHPDPHDPSQLRYWDGSQWTDHRSPNQAAAPSTGPTTGAIPVAATAPMGTQAVQPSPGGSKRGVWIALGAVALLVGGCAIGAAAAGSGDDGDSTAGKATATVTVTKEAKAAKPAVAAPATATVTVTAEASAPAPAPTADAPASGGADDVPAADDGTKPSLTLPKQNGDWRLDTLQLKNDGLGDFGGVGRITYTGEDKTGGDNLFTVTLFGKDGSTIIATLDGSATGVKPGQTVTVDFYGFDSYKAGKFPFTFQNNL